MTITDIAIVCHEANRALCQVLGDNSQWPWVAAEPWQRNSAAESVKFLLANPDAPDSVFHDQWCESKIKDGWKLGPEKDGAKKEHPCLVPFDDLPPGQKAKDTLLKGIVKALAPLLEKEVA